MVQRQWKEVVERACQARAEEVCVHISNDYEAKVAMVKCWGFLRCLLISFGDIYGLGSCHTWPFSRATSGLWSEMTLGDSQGSIYGARNPTRFCYIHDKTDPDFLSL